MILLPLVASPINANILPTLRSIFQQATPRGVRSEPVFSVRRVYRGVYVDREFNSRRVPGANGKHAVGFTGDRRVRGVLAAFFRELRPGTSKGGSAKNRIRRFPRP